MERSAKIYVAGHNGLVGSALVRRLRAGGYSKLLLRSRSDFNRPPSSSPVSSDRAS